MGLVFDVSSLPAETDVVPSSVLKSEASSSR